MSMSVIGRYMEFLKLLMVLLLLKRQSISNIRLNFCDSGNVVFT